MKKEAFIERAVAVHGDKFDYSLLPDEFKSSDKVPVVCSKHGVFYIEANSHVSRGSGCRECSIINKNEKRISDTKINFFLNAPVIHQGKYDYSKSDYLGVNTHVVIACPIHGEFKQTPHNHLTGQGCPSCAIVARALSLRYTQEKFVSKCLSVHGDRYDYSITEYKTNYSKVKIICKKHGEFLMTPNDHLAKKGCKFCGIETVAALKRDTTETFIDRSMSIHGNKYNYDLVEYISSSSPVKIVCPTHGVFLQKPVHHLRGCECPLCAAGGYDRSKSGTFYILHVNDETIKLGITHNIKRRLKDLSSGTNFKLKLIHSFDFKDGNTAWDIEKEVKSSLKCGVVSKTEMLYGHTETTHISNLPLILSIVEKYKPD